MTLTRVLILACGNTLRSDDGVGPHLAAWAEEHYRENPSIRVISRQQWTPDLAEDIAQTKSVLFLDCSVESAPGSINLISVYPSVQTQSLATHHQGAPELLSLARDLYDSPPSQAIILTIGAGSIELGEEFSEPVLTALPQACALLEQTAMHLLAGPHP